MVHWVLRLAFFFTTSNGLPRSQVHVCCQIQTSLPPIQRLFRPAQTLSGFHRLSKNVTYNNLDLQFLRYNRNEFRRNIDYTVLVFILFWGLQVVDATVDAHLKSFDVSPDLSLQIKPGYSELAHQWDKPGAQIQIKFKFPVMKIALIGYGKMGKMIEEIAVERGHQIGLKIHIDNTEEFN